MFVQQQIQGATIDWQQQRAWDVAPEASDEDEGGSAEDVGDGLEDAVQDEHEYVRARLREELQREPTEEELDEWLRRHTEGY